MDGPNKHRTFTQETSAPGVIHFTEDVMSHDVMGCILVAKASYFWINSALDT